MQFYKHKRKQEESEAIDRLANTNPDDIHPVTSIEQTKSNDDDNNNNNNNSGSLRNMCKSAKESLFVKKATTRTVQ